MRKGQFPAGPLQRIIVHAPFDLHLTLCPLKSVPHLQGSPPGPPYPVPVQQLPSSFFPLQPTLRVAAPVLSPDLWETQVSRPAGPRLETLQWPPRAAHKPFASCSLPAGSSHTQLLDFARHASLFVSELLGFLLHGMPFPSLVPLLSSPRFSSSITSADQLTRAVMEAALPPGSPSAGKTDGKESTLTGVKARPLKCWPVSPKTLPGESVLEKEWKEEGRRVAPQVL